MNLDDARQLKQTLLQTFADSASHVKGPGPSSASAGLALGVALGERRNDYRLALRIQDRAARRSPAAETIRRTAGRDLDERFIGRVRASTGSWWGRSQVRPLRIGASVGHCETTAGTLGGFVKRKADERVYLLSNNHVLARENQAELGDAILQPGPLDEGLVPVDVAAELAEFVPLQTLTANHVDAALARLTDDVDYDAAHLEEWGSLAGVGMADWETPVVKLGRTTGLTRGKVTTIELDNLEVYYEQLGLLRFNQQIEITGDDGPFSSGGDSGSLIVDESRRAVGLLFAGSETGATYANPIDAVLKRLDAELLL